MAAAHSIDSNAGLDDKSTALAVGGMTCANCARHVTEAIQEVPGVASAAVGLAAGRATVRWQKTSNLPAVVAAVQAAGYTAQPLTDEAAGAGRPQAWSPLAGWRFNVVVGLACTLPLMVGEWVFGQAMTGWFRWTAFALATVVQVGCGARFYAGAWRQLKRGDSNMDTLVALGSTTAYGYSLWALFGGSHAHLYFMESAAIITLISLGHWFEARTSARAESSLQALLHLAPQMARRRNANGSETEVPVRELRVNDRVSLKPGDHVPTDGEVTSGAATVDESMLTGESIPVEKQPGDKLYAGTVNLNGQLFMRVTATGEATALAHIIAAVARAQTSRAEIQRLGDRVSSVFVPIVVLLAVATGLWWGLAPEQARHVSEMLAKYLWPATASEGALAGALIHAAAVLIIACPCAMGLATPVAIMAGANSAARRGILIRDGVALEKAGQITALVFDKTGTITEGRPVVVKVEEFAGAESSKSVDIKKLAAALARPSNHPISRAVAALVPFQPGIPQEALATGKVERPLQLRQENQFQESPRFSPGPVRNGVMRNGIELLGRGRQLVVAPEPGADAHQEISLKDWQEVRGAGVQALVRFVGAAAPTTVRLGSLRWLQESGVDLEPGRKFEAEWANRGGTLLALSVEKQLVGMLAVEDAVKPGAEAVVRDLQQQGLRVYLLTGDNPLTAQAIARQVGIALENVFAQVRPEEKSGFIQDLRAKGGRVAFVGDGINDAPALEAADLGIAVSRASDVAREAADIILLKSEIGAVPEALGLARATLRTIKQNLFWAFFYNCAGIPLAALGFMSPILCAAAMGMSDLVVIGNALRLLRWAPRVGVVEAHHRKS